MTQATELLRQIVEALSKHGTLEIAIRISEEVKPKKPFPFHKVTTRVANILQSNRMNFCEDVIEFGLQNLDELRGFSTFNVEKVRLVLQEHGYNV